MIRTFQPQINRITLFLCLLPATVVTVYGFWTLQPWLGFIFLLFMVVCVERVIHTSYTLSDEGELTISHGRFARKQTIDLRTIEKVEIFRPSMAAKLWRNDWVGLTLKSGKVVVLQPLSVELFSAAVVKKKEELCGQ